MNSRIKKVRVSVGMTQAQFGKKLLISHASVSKLESGENAPSPQTQRLICQEFGVNPEWLLTGEGEMYASYDHSVEGLAAELLTSLRGNDFAISLYREAARRFSPEDWKKLRECLEAALEGVKKPEQP
ncbi:MAG: helix-turn-helix transcriptional regulator [Clostridiales bacterium]|nr:helix-turn-helix transcriptional regulator [Clostridiales bacterium]